MGRADPGRGVNPHHPWTRLSLESPQQPLQAAPAHRQDAIDRRLHDDLPVAAVALGTDLANPSQVHRPVVVDAVDVTMADLGDDLRETADVPQRPLASAPHDRVIAVRLEDVEVVGVDRQATRGRKVQQDAIQRCGS